MLGDESKDLVEMRLCVGEDDCVRPLDRGRSVGIREGRYFDFD